MSQKGFVNIAFVVLAVVLVGVGGYFLMDRFLAPSPPQQSPQTTNQVTQPILQLIVNKIFGDKSFPKGKITVLGGSGAGMLIAECADKNYITNSAHYIIEGKVENTESRWIDDSTLGRHIFTFTTIAAKKYVKGDPIGDTVELKTIGGRVGDKWEIATDVGSPEKGKDVILYLQKVGSEFELVCGYFGIVYPSPIPKIKSNFHILKEQNVKDLLKGSGIKSLSKKFYEGNTDDYDFLVIVSGSLVGDYIGEWPPHFGSIKNYTSGIGKHFFDSTIDYGSKGRLQGYAFINNLDDALGPNRFHGINAFVHELSHYWIMNLGNDELKIRRDGGHWSNFVDTSVQINGKIYLNPNGGGIWQENSDGTFSALHAYDIYTEESYRRRFSSLDLYLMGFIPASETRPVQLIIPEGQVDTDQNIRGTKRLVTVQDLIRLGGQRDPAYPNTQRDFNIALILVIENEPTESQLATMDWIAKNLPEVWFEATSHKSKLIIK
ncbi:hypothetical protein KJ991_02490 [Patescibacteria group bacterium]|nr:hypothetical protein [Patescibacteria group bacterium]MBU4057768.1 hypothetical protein [Patescibacteria group bacterium]MBU4115854.1 hypothetical protein [Patescibacteria group bacterium]